MPCRDGGPPPAPGTYEDLRNRLDFLNAALCAALTVYVDAGLWDKMLEQIDWDEAGITQQALETWWEGHREEDRRRRERERAQHERERLKESALRKLTPEEMRALGIAPTLGR